LDKGYGFRYPSDDDCCVLFDGSDYEGETREYCLDGEPTRSIDLTNDFDNKMNGWVCGKSVWYEFCDSWDECHYANGTCGAGAAYTPWVKWTNRLSRLNLYEYDAVNGHGAALLWTEYDCKGTSSPFFSGDPGQTAYYTDNDLWYYNYHHDWTSSVMVPVGYEITLWDWDSFEGDSVKYEGMEDSNGYMTCQNLNNFNDRTASAAIMKKL